MSEKKKRKMKKYKRNISKKQKIVFWGWLWTIFFVFSKMAFLRKIGKHYLCSEGKRKTRIFVATICFLKMSLFWVSAGTGKTQNGTFGFQSAFLGFPSKGGSTICDTQKLCSAEKHNFIVSAKHSFADMKECNLKKTTNYKEGAFCQTAKGVFWSFFCLLVVLFSCCLCFCAFVL